MCSHFSKLTSKLNFRLQDIKWQLEEKVSGQCWSPPQALLQWVIKRLNAPSSGQYELDPKDPEPANQTITPNLKYLKCSLNINLLFISICASKNIHV